MDCAQISAKSLSELKQIADESKRNGDEKLHKMALNKYFRILEILRKAKICDPQK